MFICKYTHCLSTKTPYYKENGPHVEQFCRECGKHQKFISKKKFEALKIVFEASKKLF